MKNISLKRQARSKRKVTVKGTEQGRCIHQSVQEVGQWPSGQPMHRVRYYHVTKGWRERLLRPLMMRAS